MRIYVKFVVTLPGGLQQLVRPAKTFVGIYERADKGSSFDMVNDSFFRWAENYDGGRVEGSLTRYESTRGKRNQEMNEGHSDSRKRASSTAPNFT